MSTGREGAVYSRGGELKTPGGGAQQTGRQLSETSASGRIRLQVELCWPTQWFFLVDFAANQLHVKILIPSLWQNPKT